MKALCTITARNRNVLLFVAVVAMLVIANTPAMAADEGLIPNISHINAVWYWYIAPVMAVVALFFAVKFYREVKAANPGDEKMIAIADHVTAGAMAYLKR